MAYIFVGGSQRTGTSIMQQTLCQLPGANPYVYESTYLRLQLEAFAQARHNFSRNHEVYFGSLDGLIQFHSGVVRAFLLHTAQRLGNCEHLILKEPHLTLFWPELFELVPESMFLMMIRDPRDVIASMVEVGRRQKEIGQEYLFADRDIPAMCDHFLSFYSPAFSVTDERFRKRLAIVHYEEMVTDPVQLLKEITVFTGLPFDAIDAGAKPAHGHVEPVSTASSQMYSPWVTEVSGQKLSPKRVGNYAKVLTPDEIAIVEERCADMFEWFGYSRKAA